ncbi:MAG: hypothetical protein ACC645_10620 [Pirellulales bacterium]
MTKTTMDMTEIEQIVREVVRRIEGLAVPDDRSAGRSGVLHVEGPVVSLASLQSQLDGNGEAPSSRVVHPTSLNAQLEGIDRVAVAARAVVTPAVRDLLQERSISLILGVEGPTGCDAAPTESLLVGIDIDSVGQVGGWDALERKIPVERARGCDLAGLIDTVATEVQRDRRLALLLTEQTAVALCLANRQQGVRAVLATDMQTEREAVDSVGANLLICSPRRTVAGERLRMVEHFYRRGVVECPDKLRERLG